MGYTTTYRQHIQNEDSTDSIKYASFDIESGHLTWSGNTEIVYYTPATQVKSKSSNTRW
jgi:hypothetical protein